MNDEKILTLLHLAEEEAQVILSRKYGRLKEMVSSEGGLEKLIELRKQQFWSKVKIGQQDECWPWIACRLPKSATRKHDYGWCNMMGRPMHAHRMSIIITHGYIDETFDSCHICDNPPCVNLNHLFLGTAKDNTQDCITKNRFVYAPVESIRGERHYLTHLTNQDVIEIRRQCELGVMHKDMAKHYGVSPGTIGRMVRRETWTHI